MGRRFLLILGILLLAAPALPMARAQDGSGPPSLDAASSELPVPKPLDLPATDDRMPADEAAKSAPPRARPAAKARARDEVQEANAPGRTSPESSTGAPPLSPVPPDDPAVPAGAATGAGRASRPPPDPELARTDGPSAMPGDAGAGPLPAGKQAVAVTVDVQSPPNMNLHVPATVRILVRNTGTSDALDVRIRDELPAGLKYVSSQPQADKVEGAVLTWSLGKMPSGSEAAISLKVEPIKPGPLEHGASVWFQTGSMAPSRIFEPRLKIELLPSSAQVLKGQQVEFKVVVTNTGDGPARKVTVAAKLSPGLRHGSGERGSDEMVTEPIPVLAPGQSEEIDPLIADAVRAGNETCTVSARSPDVIAQEKGEEARSVASVTVVEPKLTVAVSGPSKRCTDTNAVYTVAVANPGTADARKVRVVAFVPPGARLVALPKNARYDTTTRRLQWSIDTIRHGPDSQKLAFEVKVGAVGKYEVSAEATAEGGLKAARQSLATDVFGMADVDLVVSERQRVIDVGGKTVFLITLRNYGTKEATNLRLWATVTKNLKVTGSLDKQDGPALFDTKEGNFVWQDDGKGGIKSLGPGKTMVLGLEVEVTADKPEVATCKVFVKHDGLPEPFEDSAHVKVLTASPRPAEAASP